MAQKTECDNEMAALEAAFQGVLNVDDNTAAGAGSIQYYRQGATSESPCSGDVNVVLRESPPIIGTTHLALRKITVTAHPTISGAPDATSCTHVILHVEGASLFPPCNSENSSDNNGEATGTVALLETISLSLIGDKFPLYDLGGLTFENSFLIKFWADLNFWEDPRCPVQFLSDIRFQSSKIMAISCTTRIATFGQMMGEKVEPLQCFAVGVDQFTYLLGASLCELFVKIIKKLRSDEMKTIMNEILENFTVLQVITDDTNKKTIMCLAYVFEACTPEQSATSGASSKVYRLDPSPPTPSQSITSYQPTH